MAIQEYPRHLHNKKPGGEPRVVNSDKERDQALNDGYTLEPQHNTSPDAPESEPRQDLQQGERRAQAMGQAKSDQREVERSGAARADHEAKQNAEQEARRRGDTELRPEDFKR